MVRWWCLPIGISGDIFSGIRSVWSEACAGMVFPAHAFLRGGMVYVGRDEL